MTPGLPSPNGASRSSSAQRPSVERGAGDDRVDHASTGAGRRRRAAASAWAANASANASTLLRAGSRGRRRRGGRRSARGARRRRRARRAGRTPGSSGRSPSSRPSVAGDQDDGPVEALDEARGDDPDHALVPVLARDDVAAPAALRLGPRLDLGDRLAQDPVLDRLALAVQLLELARRAARPPRRRRSAAARARRRGGRAGRRR